MPQNGLPSMPTDTRFLVRRYIAEGWSVLPIPHGSKAPEAKDWVNRTFSESDFKEDDNIGVRLGTPSGGLIDVDLDQPEAVQAAKTLLLKTERIHGRPGTGASHYWYLNDTLKSERWVDTDGKVIVEIRSTGGQTVVPESVHPSGERLAWEIDRPPSPVDAEGLRRSVRLVATAALLAKKWPKGSRHVAARDAAGYLCARDLDPREIEEIIRAAASIAKDDEVEDRVRVARDTAKQFASGGKTTGGPTLAAAIGEDTVALLTKWYGGNSSIHDGIIDEMNRKHFVVRIGKDEVIGTEDEGEVVFQHERALALRYANQRIKITEVKGKPVYENVFQIWKTHSKRRSHRSVVFLPPPAQANPRDYNLWTGFGVSPLDKPAGISLESWIDQDVRPKCARYLHLIDSVICDGHEGHREYLLDLMAAAVQKPAIKSEVCTVLKGDRGTGKGVFIRTFGSLFGNHFAHVTKPEQVVGKFNAMVSSRVVIFADEAFFAGDKKDLGALKVLITEPTISIERKGIDPVMERNFVHLFMASNEDWHTPAGFHERRFFVLKVSDAQMQNPDYFGAITAEMEAGGREALLTLLLHRPLTEARWKDLRKAPHTDELRRQQEHTMAPEMRWWKECLAFGATQTGTEPPWPTTVNVTALHLSYLRWCDTMKINRRVSVVDFGRGVLAAWLGSKRINTHTEQGWVRSLLPLTQARQEFDRVAGLVTPWDEDPLDGAGVPGAEDDQIPF